MKKLTCGVSSIPIIVYLMGNEDNKIIGWADADCFVVINIVSNKGCISYAHNFKRLIYDTRHKVFHSDHEYSKEYYELKTSEKECHLLDGIKINNFKK